MEDTLPLAPQCSRRQIVRAMAALGAVPLLSYGQEEPTFSTGVKVVSLLATVRNKKREIVRGLGKSDFLLSEDGRPQAIRYFSRDSDLPLTLGLMVDTSMSQRRVLDAERRASFRFLDQVLRETKDQVFVMQFDMAILLSQPLTSSRKQLDEALSLVDTPSMDELRRQGSSGGTLLYDAIVKACRDIMGKQSGRKALIVLTDGVDIGSEAHLADATEAAQRADTLVYSILFSDAGAYGFGFGGPDGRGAMQRISKETGAGFFEVSKKLSVQQIFDVIQEELRGQYSLGYVSDVPVRVSEFRKLRLTAAQTGLIVQARDRYWAQR